MKLTLNTQPNRLATQNILYVCVHTYLHCIQCRCMYVCMYKCTFACTVCTVRMYRWTVVQDVRTYVRTWLHSLQHLSKQFDDLHRHCFVNIWPHLEQALLELCSEHGQVVYQRRVVELLQRLNTHQPNLGHLEGRERKPTDWNSETAKSVRHYAASTTALHAHLVVEHPSDVLQELVREEQHTTGQAMVTAVKWSTVWCLKTCTW